MTVYATAPRPASAGRAIRYSWLVATTEAELDAFASVLGVTHVWRHPGDADMPPYYVLNTVQRADALAKGAVGVKTIPDALKPAAAGGAGLFTSLRGGSR